MNESLVRQTPVRQPEDNPSRTAEPVLAVESPPRGHASASRFRRRARRIRSTTVLCVRAGDKVVMGGDGQVTMGEGVIKHRARKIRRLFNQKVLAGFAGSTADAFSLFSRFETKLEQYHGNLSRAAVELAKDWRTDKILRHLEALLIVADERDTFLISGQGDIIEPDDGVCAIGSGGPYALAAARAMLAHTKMDARAIVIAALELAADICIYTNRDLTVEESPSLRGVTAAPGEAGSPVPTEPPAAG